MAELKQRVVLYHGQCLDGFGAAVAARHYFGADDTDYVAVSYHRPLPEFQLESDLWFVDFCPTREALNDLLAMGHSVTVLDHHLTTEEAVSDVRNHSRFNLVYRTDESGAVITWKHFFPDEKVPRLFMHIQDRDLWNWAYPDTAPITDALNCVDFDFFTWGQFIKYPESLVGLRDSGDMLVIHRRKTVALVKQRYYHSTIGRYTGIPTVNSDSYVSDLGAALVRDNPDAPFVAVWYMRGDGSRKYCLRSDGEFDCSKVAESFGGGGHAAAAGFVVP